MALRPSDMLEIQSAIDQYERKFPRRPPPSAEVALAWRLGKREAKKRAARQSDAGLGLGGEEEPLSEVEQQECNRLVWAWEQLRLQWHIWTVRKDDAPPRTPEMLPWVKGALLVGCWSVFAVAVASVFFFGAIVGGFK
jgi:hypothetical protein